MSEQRYECAKCGEPFSEGTKVCPKCGSNQRRILVTLSDEIKLRETLKGKLKDELGKAKRKITSRSKLSKKGKEAKEVLDIDIEGDRKFHHVEELDNHGNWTVVHHEDEPLKKKPKSK